APPRACARSSTAPAAEAGHGRAPRRRPRARGRPRRPARFRAGRASGRTPRRRRGRPAGSPRSAPATGGSVRLPSARPWLRIRAAPGIVLPVTPFEPPVERLAELIVDVGANVRPGQIVEVSSDLGKEALTRSIAGAAYRRGARFVDVQYYDPHVKRERIRHAPEEAIGFIPRWFGERVRELGEERAASISLSGPVGPHL